MVDVNNPAYKHGHAGRAKFSPEYYSWTSMMKRCNNSNSTYYYHYGGRGILVCDRWKSFVLFLEDMGFRPSKEHTLDRIDPNKGYCKENCRWATKKEQANNKRLGKWGSIELLIPTLINEGFNTSNALYRKLKDAGLTVHEETVRELTRKLYKNSVISINREKTGKYRKNIYCVVTTCQHNGGNNAL